MIEVAGELDLLVPDFGDAGERALEIRFHLIADGVELDPDLLEACAVCHAQCAGARNSNARRGQGLHELAPISAHASHSSLLFMASTAYAAARAVNAMYVMDGF